MTRNEYETLCVQNTGITIEEIIYEPNRTEVERLRERNSGRVCVTGSRSVVRKIAEFIRERTREDEFGIRRAS